MATKITDVCISCGACEPECPNGAISQGDSIYVIDPAKCNECVGFHDEMACSSVCPVDAPQPDPDRVETEAQLLEKGKKLNPGKQFPALDQLPAALSHFRKGK